MNPWEKATLLFDENIRVNKIIWLTGNTADQSDDFKELFEDEDIRDIAEMLNVKLKYLKEEVEQAIEANNWEGVSSFLCRAQRYGFFVEASTPLPMDFSKDGSGCSFSWGVTRPHWFYTEDLNSEEFVQELLNWKEKVWNDQRRYEKKRNKS